MSWLSPVLAGLLVVGAGALALAFKPFAVLRNRALRAPWLAALAIVPIAWLSPAVLPGGPSLRISFSCLLVLMFGWPLAIWTLLAVAMIAALIAGDSIRAGLELAAWYGSVPASLALLLGIAIRRWLPPHIFVYILGRGFIGTALAVMAAGMVATWVQPLPPGTTASTLLVGYWLMAWAEAVLTGMLTAIFVALRPEWLLTWSDKRYLPRPPGR
jgi:uncharacterized membrane protein